MLRKDRKLDVVVTLAPAKRAKRSKEKTSKQERPRVIAGKGKILCLVALGALATGCSGSYMGDYDLVVLGNERGLDRLIDHNVGLVNEGKASPDVKSAHYGLREEQTGLEALKLKLQEMKNERR